ncbi:MAG TPA: transporter substrate-binding domain-containing protein [Rhizomicrobium sp.]|nr:transporter substrate-binding domain-containing protein [Rhizomicrobium sp.]
MKIRPVLIVPILLVAALQADRAVAAPELTIMVEDASEPFSRADGSGYANDVVRAAYKAAGVKLTLNVVPYARCREFLKRALTPACFAMSWSKDLENTGIVFSDEPLFEVHADVFLNSESQKRPKSFADIPPGSTVGIINGYEYPDDVYAMEKAGIRLERNINDSANLKMLAHNRLDAIILMTSEFDNIARRRDTGEPRNIIRFAFQSELMKSYLAFNLKNPQGKFARDTFERGYSLIVSSHETDRIRQHWKKLTLQ